MGIGPRPSTNLGTLLMIAHCKYVVTFFLLMAAPAFADITSARDIEAIPDAKVHAVLVEVMKNRNCILDFGGSKAQAKAVEAEITRAFKEPLGIAAQLNDAGERELYDRIDDAFEDLAETGVIQMDEKARRITMRGC